jgi:hypothetical protein
MWMASIVSTPSIDLRGTVLTPAQWCMLAAAISQTPSNAIKSLHLEAGSNLKVVAQVFARNPMGSKYLGYYQNCGSVKYATFAFGNANCNCSGCNELQIYRPAVMMCSLEGIRVRVINSFAQERMQLFGTVQSIVSHTFFLQTLGLHSVLLTSQSMYELQQLLVVLPATLTELHISTCEVPGFTVAKEDKTLFFKAVAQVSSLRELHMPQWKYFVGEDASVCTEPLHIAFADLRPHSGERLCCIPGTFELPG